MPENPIKIDKNMPWCHRFFVPMAYAEQTPSMPGIPARVEPKGNIIFMKCLGDQCSVWDKEAKQCSELSRNLATKRMAELHQMKREEITIVGSE